MLRMYAKIKKRNCISSPPEENCLINRLVLTSSETRKICNDPRICGVEYTRLLQSACTEG